MGGIVSSILGIGQQYEAPEPIKYDPVPSRTEATEPEAQAVRESERRKIRARRSMSGTLLTSPLGVNGVGTTGGTNSPGLLGRV